VAFVDIPAIREKLTQMLQQLDVCQRALSDFLEDKRSSFPRCGCLGQQAAHAQVRLWHSTPCARFYFLGDDDLLELLGQSQNPTVIQSHMKKLFAGIHKV